MTLSFQFGTVGSPLATPKKPGGSVGAIEFSKSIGLNTLELGWVQSVRVTEVTCAAIKAKAEEQSVSLSVHAPYFINLNALDDEWPKSRKRLMDAAVYGNLAGATDIIFHPGSYFGNHPAGSVEACHPTLAGLCGGTAQSRKPGHIAARNDGKIGNAWLIRGYAGNEQGHRRRGTLHRFCPPACPSRRWDDEHL